jgi:hypothetical protein
MSQPLLTYTPPLQRDLRPPWSQPRGRNIVDCSDREGDYSIELHRFHFTYPYGPLRPALIVSTARLKHYEDNTHQDYETTLWFRPGRESFRAAYQLARILRKGNGCAAITPNAMLHYYAIDVAKRHSISVLEKVVPYAEFVASERIHTCKICGCNDLRSCEGGCSWANPQSTLCTRCLRGLLLVALESGMEI